MKLKRWSSYKNSPRLYFVAKYLFFDCARKFNPTINEKIIEYIKYIFEQFSINRTELKNSPRQDIYIFHSWIACKKIQNQRWKIKIDIILTRTIFEINRIELKNSRYISSLNIYSSIAKKVYINNVLIKSRKFGKKKGIVRSLGEDGYVQRIAAWSLDYRRNLEARAGWAVASWYSPCNEVLRRLGFADYVYRIRIYPSFSLGREAFQQFGAYSGGTPAARESERSEVVNKLCWTIAAAFLSCACW